MSDDKKPKQDPGKREWRQDSNDPGLKKSGTPSERKQDLQPPKPFPKPSVPNDKTKTK